MFIGRYLALVLWSVTILSCRNSSNSQPADPVTQDNGQRTSTDSNSNSINTTDNKGQPDSSTQSEGVSESTCLSRSDDYTWVEGKCIEKPNNEINGVLNLIQGTIWSPNSDTCTRGFQDNATKLFYFKKCAGANVTIPLARLQNLAVKNRVRIGFDCKSIIQATFYIKIGNVESTIGSSLDGKDVLDLETSLGKNEEQRLTLIFKPGNENQFLSTCKIDLRENSAVEEIQN